MCDYPEAYREINRKARKQHKCCECRKPINIGDIYQYASGVWDGSPSSYKTCTPCAELRNKISSETQEGVEFGMLLELIEEAAQPEKE